MKTLIIGAGPLGSLYTYLFHKAGKDVTLLARNEHFEFLNENGLILVNEFTQEKMVENVNVINQLHEEDEYDLVIILMRKNSLLKLLPTLSKHKYLHNILFMGNNTAGFEEYLKYFPKEKILFGFPGGGGSRKDHIVHYIDSEKPKGARMHVTIGEVDGKVRVRTLKVKELFESSHVPVKLVDDIDGWLKYHVAFINPLAGALLKSGDNYKLAKDEATIRTYIRAVNEVSMSLKALGYKKSYNRKLDMFSWLPEWILVRILKKVFDSRFAEIAMMMHVNSARDEMIELGNELKTLIQNTDIKTPNLDKLLPALRPGKVEELEMFGAQLEMPKEAVKEQEKIMLKALKTQFGFWGMIGVFIDMFFIQNRLKRDFPESSKKAAAISKGIEKELFIFSALFLALSKRLGRQEAYEFFKTKVMNEIAKTSMALIYQVPDLIRCNGDAFDNFKKMNLAMFERTTENGSWVMDSFQDDPDKLTVKIGTCANVELFNELGVPELGKFGCDHDIAGYTVIEKEVNCEFRRFCTIANGDDHCLFEFYRRGKAPDNAHLNI